MPEFFLAQLCLIPQHILYTPNHYVLLKFRPFGFLLCYLKYLTIKNTKEHRNTLEKLFFKKAGILTVPLYNLCDKDHPYCPTTKQMRHFFLPKRSDFIFQFKQMNTLSIRHLFLKFLNANSKTE